MCTQKAGSNTLARETCSWDRGWVLWKSAQRVHKVQKVHEVQNPSSLMELECILEGRFTVAKNGLPVRPIFQRNHKSWKDDSYAQDVIILVLSEWFNAGSLEYVERFHRLPHCILAVGAVEKSTRLVTDGRPINIYAEGWRVEYATVGDICLMLTRCSLIWIRDLKNAYHLVRLGGHLGTMTIEISGIS